ncbi:hypothetical protein HRG_003572 [Hirsutella rhossiliensis]|uniref:Tat pathway signal sequence n=1 Tax=Hirsutella rhossiliensis TaxID=111463 RepID=A0A9P8SLW1_9HYPO|nr:uncharacterized protein HRG_03572 [Hirsutella rhossiliensis]KAH0965556.1 hypothetical protein HRG_03572 [Hirsutella rhossiliensis]
MAPPSRDASLDAEAGEALLEKHSSLSDSESSQFPLCPSCARRQARQPSVFRKKGLWVTYLNLVLFLTSILLLIGARRSLRPPPPSGREVVEATSAYSPIFDAVDLTPVPLTVDGRLHAPANASVFRGEPSNVTDAAWDDVSAEAYEVILVNATVLERAGYNPTHYFKAPSSWGHGEGQYPVQIDVFHQIHCLNAVRKQMYYQHYYADEFPNGPDEMHWMHQRHCLHMVLQSLMCNANVDIVPHRWVEKDNKPFAQFSIQRQCRNFDSLRSWNKKNAVKNVRDLWPHDKKAMPQDAFVWSGFGESFS